MKILLTRPDFDSKNLALKLKESKHTIEIAPLIRIAKVTSAKDFNFNSFNTLIFTSKNGIRYFGNSSLKEKLIFTVGDGTYKAAKETGYKNINNADGDVSNLISLIDKNFYKIKANILHITSLQPNKLFINAFNNTNINYETLPVYESRKIDNFKIKIENFLIQNSGALTFFSPKTADSFLNIVKQMKLYEYCSKQIIIVLSKQIIKRLESLQFKKIFIAEKPNEESLLSIINNL